ncbi:MAG: hypothetical protein JRI39_02690 [Deltaproteobacteria bacterium]|nr:hypothetical protein [Deltaproteobacteria bacterium]
MYPELIHLDSIILRSYGLLIALAIAISFATGLILFRKQGLPLEEGLRSGLFMLGEASLGASWHCGFTQALEAVISGASETPGPRLPRLELLSAG